MRVVSFSEARKHLKSVLDTVNDDANATIVTRRDADDAVVMSLDYYNSSDGNRLFIEISCQCSALSGIYCPI